MKTKLISPAVESLIQEAIYNELYASNLYKHVANSLQSIGYFGATKHFQEESADELTHYQKHVEFLNNRGSVAIIPELPLYTQTVTSLKDALVLAYGAETALSTKYEEWTRECAKTDFTAYQHLLQFIEIQQTSIGFYGDMLVRLGLVEGDMAGTLLIDQELGE